MGIEEREDNRLLPALSFKARIFVALVGISSVTSLIIGLVLYYFAQDRLVHAENTLLKQRSQTANAGAQDFLEGLRDPEDKTLPPPPDYGDELGDTLAYLRYGILGAILTSILLAGAASLLLTRQVTRPLSETRDAAIRVASGDYAATVPVKSRDELGEVARTFNYMAEEIEHYVGEIQEQKSRLEAVLEASPEAVVATDSGERVTMVNAAAARMLGIRASDRGRTLEEIGAPSAVLKCLREAAANGVAVRELELGEKAFWAYAAQMDRGQPPNAPNGDAGIILAVRDITEHRSLEKAKTAFVSDLSHELRTPLTTIQSAVGLLERARDRLDPLEHRALELADQELKRIRGMVEELMTLALMDSWQYQLEVGPTDLGRIVQTAIESVESKAERFGIAIYFDDTSEHRCVCDGQKLYQVFLILLDNAIKYSEAGARGEITIKGEVT